MAGKSSPSRNRTRARASKPYERPKSNRSQQSNNGVLSITGALTSRLKAIIPSWLGNVLSGPGEPSPNVLPPLLESDEPLETQVNVNHEAQNENAREFKRPSTPRLNDSLTSPGNSARFSGSPVNNGPTSSTPMVPATGGIITRSRGRSSRSELEVPLSLPKPSTSGSVSEDVANGGGSDDRSENSETSGSTSGCSSLVPSCHERVELSERLRESLRKQLDGASGIARSSNSAGTSRRHEVRDFGCSVDATTIRECTRPASGGSSLSGSLNSGLWSSPESRKRPPPPPPEMSRSPQFSVAAFRIARQSPDLHRKPEWSLNASGSGGSQSAPTSRAASPFYAGRTTYGGAATYRRLNLFAPSPYTRQAPNTTKRLSVGTGRSPLTSISEEGRCFAGSSPLRTGSPAAAAVGSPSGTTSSAQRMLAALEKINTPLSNARKIPLRGPMDTLLAFEPPTQRRRLRSPPPNASTSGAAPRISGSGVSRIPTTMQQQRPPTATCVKPLPVRTAANLEGVVVSRPLAAAATTSSNVAASGVVSSPETTVIGSDNHNACFTVSSGNDTSAMLGSGLLPSSSTSVPSTSSPFASSASSISTRPFTFSTTDALVSDGGRIPSLERKQSSGGGKMRAQSHSQLHAPSVRRMQQQQQLDCVSGSADDYNAPDLSTAVTLSLKSMPKFSFATAASSSGGVFSTNTAASSAMTTTTTSSDDIPLIYDNNSGGATSHQTRSPLTSLTDFSNKPFVTTTGAISIIGPEKATIGGGLANKVMSSGEFTFAAPAVMAPPVLSKALQDAGDAPTFSFASPVVSGASTNVGSKNNFGSGGGFSGSHSLSSSLAKQTPVSASLTDGVSTGNSVSVNDSSPFVPVSNTAVVASPLPPLKAVTTGWECSVCLVRNATDATSCIACESPKPGATPKPSATSSAFGTTSSLPPLSSLVKPKVSGSWECSICMVKNGPSDSKCIACETPKPGAKPVLDASSVSPSGFKFGASSSPATTSSTSGGFGGFAFKTPTSSSAASLGGSSGGFKFGAASSDTEKKDSSATPKVTFKFGDTPLSTKETTISSFGGSSTAADAQKDTDNPSAKKSPFGATLSMADSFTTPSSSAAVSNQTFSFGSPLTSTGPQSSIIEPTDNIFTKAAAASDAAAVASSIFGGLTKSSSIFGGDSAAKSVSTSDGDSVASSKPSSTVSASAVTSSSTPKFSFEPSTTASSTPSFSFGATTTSVATTSEATSTLPKPVFAFTTPLSPATTTAAEKDVPKPTFQFSSPTSGSGSGFVFGNKSDTKLASPTANFTFGTRPVDQGITTTGTTSTVTTGDTTTAPSSGLNKTGVVSFGASSAISADKPVFSFGTSTPAAVSSATLAPASTTGSVFGSPSTQTSGMFAFGGDSAAKPTFSFGAASTPATTITSSVASSSALPVFSFGSSQPVASSATTTSSVAAPSPFAFGASAAVSSNPAVAATTTSTTTTDFKFGGFASTPAASTVASSPFSFGQGTSTSVLAGGASTASSVAPAAPAFSFAQSAPVTSSGPSPFMFGASSATAPTSTAAASPATNAFASNPATTSAPSPFAFGQTANSVAPAASTASPFQFGASAPKVPAVFQFGAANNNSPSKAAFGGSPFQFGANSGGTNSAAAPQAPGESVFRFGATPQATNPSTGQAASPFQFGSPAPAGATPFQFGSPAAAPSAAPNMFGSQPATAAPPPFMANGSDNNPFSVNSNIGGRKIKRAVRRRPGGR